LISAPIYKKGNNTDCRNYTGIPVLSTTYKTLSNFLLSMLTPYAEEIIGDHQGGFWHNMSTTVHIFCTSQIPEKNGNKMKQCISYFRDFKKAYDSAKREVLYNILIEYGTVCVGKYLSDMFPIKNDLK